MGTANQRDYIQRLMGQYGVGYLYGGLPKRGPDALREAKEHFERMLRPVPQRVFLDKLGRLTPKKFTQFVCDLLGRMGFQTVNTDGPGDRGIDFRVKLPEGVVLGQCKRIKGKVGPSAVRDLHSAITTEKAELGVIVTTSELTGGAMDLAREVGIGWIDGWRLFDIVKEHWPERLEGPVP